MKEYWFHSETAASYEIDTEVSRFLEYMQEDHNEINIVSITQSSVIDNDGNIYVTVSILGLE